MADKKNWLQLLAYVTGSINQELLLRNEYLMAENHILKSQIKGRLRLSDGERATLAGIAKRLGRKVFTEESGNGVRRALPSREKPSRERKCSAFSSG